MRKRARQLLVVRWDEKGWPLCKAPDNQGAKRNPIPSAKIRNSNFRQKYGRREAPSVLHSPRKILILQGFALPRLIFRPQEGSGEECGRVFRTEGFRKFDGS